MHFWQWIPAASIGLAFAVTLAVLGVWRRRAARAVARNPLAHALLRSPGESLRARMADATLDAAEYAALALFALPLAAALLAPRWAGEAQLPPREALIALAGAAALLQAWLAWRLWRTLGRARSLALEYEAEVAAGQELERLTPLGYRVFHHMPVAERGFSVDHVVVGPGGVFAVETEGRTARRANGAEWEVAYDGSSLHFPGWRETRPLEQAVTRAAWMRTWLSATVGEMIPVQPMLVLPGWSVKRTAVSGIPVLAARRIGHFFGALRRQPVMSEAMIERLAQQLDLRCRNAA
jgi:hypothetical protein